MFDDARSRRKLVVFTEHRDTLEYLIDRIGRLLGRREAVVSIHGGMGREERKRAEGDFKQNKDVQVLVATDAAGEGINLQRAHLTVPETALEAVRVSELEEELELLLLPIVRRGRHQ